MCNIYKTINFYNKASNSGKVINATKKGLEALLYDIIYLTDLVFDIFQESYFQIF